MTGLMEVTAYEGMGDTTFIKKVTINPEYIVSIEEDSGHGIIHLSNKSILRVVETREEVVELVRQAMFPNTTGFTYIKG